MMPPTSVIGLAPILGSHPLQVPLAPDVNESHREDPKEHEPVDEGRDAQPLEDYGPRKEEDGFHIEDDEDEGEYVEPDVELDPGGARGILAAFVGCELLLAVTGGADDLPEEEVEGEKTDHNDQKPEHARVGGQEVSARRCARHQVPRFQETEANLNQPRVLRKRLRL